VAAPSLRTGFAASACEAQFVIGGYIVAYAVLLITGARLGQTHGCRRLFLLGITLFGIGSSLAGLAPDVVVLIAARVVQGVGAAAMFRRR
jgi:MFS family permease